jgi:hypothetical protein
MLPARTRPALHASWRRVEWPPAGRGALAHAACCCPAACRWAPEPAPAGSALARRSGHRRGCRSVVRMGSAHGLSWLSWVEEVSGRRRHTARRRRLVVDSRGLWLMPALLAAHEQHRLRHRLVHLHRVMSCAAGQAVDRQADGLHGLLPAGLPCWCAGCRRGAPSSLPALKVRPRSVADGAPDRRAGRSAQASRASLVVARRSRLNGSGRARR